MLAAAALLLAIAIVVVLATRGDAAPADDAAKLVPPDALVYAHLSTSEGRTQDARLLALAGRFSTVRERVPALGDGADARRRRPGLRARRAAVARRGGRRRAARRRQRRPGSRC